jgi:hypothetical protein
LTLMDSCGSVLAASSSCLHPRQHSFTSSQSSCPTQAVLITPRLLPSSARKQASCIPHIAARILRQHTVTMATKKTSQASLELQRLPATATAPPILQKWGGMPQNRRPTLLSERGPLLRPHKPPHNLLHTKHHHCPAAREALTLHPHSSSKPPHKKHHTAIAAEQPRGLLLAAVQRTLPSAQPTHACASHAHTTDLCTHEQHHTLPPPSNTPQASRPQHTSVHPTTHTVTHNTQ